ncbi:MAG TPA: histidine kinase dimerization/phosphoacceptor domain-containing protein [Beutenbergiaceae bacterium]|nr:histidine kinase dimerization/phosphoacceptor domain-containing protein [Beutenbergiaceae bacterium]
MPTTPLDSPPRPRFLADIALAAIVLLFLGLPSLALASTAWDDAFLLLPIQRAFAGPAAEQALVTGRIVVGVAAAVGMPTALVWRATNPTFSTTAVGALALAHFLTGAVLLPVDLVIFISLYSLTVHGTSQAQRVGLAAACGGALLIAASFTFDLAGLNIVAVGGMVTALGLTLVLLSWGAGLLRRARKDQRESLRQRALRAERERDQQAYLATIAERNRIAREMHDVVAHSLSVIVAQADGGRYAASTDPDSAREALETISDTSRSALADIRGILGV